MGNAKKHQFTQTHSELLY